MEQNRYRIKCGDAKVLLHNMSSQKIDIIVTSPPYYKQRDYGEENQIGQESKPEDYIIRLASIFTECHRVLKDTGSLWLNLGDKYLDNKLLGLPWQVALSLIKNGWILRSEIIWNKPNAMPTSVRNRPSTSHEHIFLFVKTMQYYYDADAIREPHVTFSEKSKMMGGRNHFGKRGSTPESGKNGGNSNLHNARWDQAFHPNGRNKRTVWEIPLSKYPDAHFAVYPEKLVEPCILAGSKENGIVLDPFCGSGTTGVVAIRHKRKFIGIDCNKAYCEMAERRVANELNSSMS